MFTFLLVVHAIIAASLVTVILMQRSEGGGLGMGSGPSGLMTARGAADFLTRATSVLATLFVLMAFLLAALASFRNGSAGQIDTSLAHQAAPGPINAPLPASPTSAIPMMGGPLPAAPIPLPAAAPAAGPAESKQSAPTPAPTPSISHLKTIDTHAVAEKIGINGISIKPAAALAPAVSGLKAGPDTRADVKPANDAAPAANGTGNQAQ